jgi:uncharacterized protein YraI
VTKDGVNVRAGANTNFEQMYQVRKGEKLVVKAKSYNWYKIALPKAAACFIKAKYVNAADEKSGVVSANRVNIRARAGEKYSIVGQANKGDIVTIGGVSNGWYAISPLDNCYGWIHENFVKFSAAYNGDEASDILKREITVQNIETPEVAVTVAPTIAPTLAPTPTPEPSKAQGELFEATGIVAARGKVFNRRGSHKLLVNGKPAYYLEGERGVFDNFLNLKVKVSGEKQEVPSSDLPVISVKSIIASP